MRQFVLSFPRSIYWVGTQPTLSDWLADWLSEHEIDHAICISGFVPNDQECLVYMGDGHRACRGPDDDEGVTHIKLCNLIIYDETKAMMTKLRWFDEVPEVRVVKSLP